MPLGFRRLVFGAPLRTERAHHERLPILLALPIFASDALSSVAYATETILRQFGSMHVRHVDFRAALPISIGIIALILMVVVSYRQVIYAYPQGGGSYVVARENLGLLMGLLAASALLVDYVLTVAVSIADCVAQSDSALNQFGGGWSTLFDSRVLAGVVLVLIITYLNLRGVRESGAVFAGPSYGFILVIFAMLAATGWRLFAGGGPAENVAFRGDPLAGGAVDWVTLVRGFASGCAALTGIEAVSNGVQAFRAPEDRNASITLGILGVILGVLFIGITYFAVVLGISPQEHETVVSQIARAAFGTTGALAPMYYAVQLFTALILFLAANTAFAGFPRLASILATDGFLPRQLASLGDRLAYNNGIVVLGFLAILFLVVFHGEAHALLPLYTIGVFIAFSTAQAGMVRRSLRARPVPWAGLAVNLAGGVVTSVVLVVITASKFVALDQKPLFGTAWLYEGAWMALLLMALVVWLFVAINTHYRNTDAQLATIPPESRRPLRHRVIVLVGSRIHRGIVTALDYARSLSPEAVAVHIAYDQESKNRLRLVWEEHGDGTTLIVLDSPYRELVGPLMDYLDATEKVHEDDVVTVILPEFVPARWWHNFLHNASGWLLRVRLFYRRDVVITSVRYYLDR